MIIEINSRRKFLKDACGACAAGVGLLVLATEAESCKTATTATSSASNKISIPKSNFASTNSYVLNDKRLPNKVMVMKNADGSFKAISLKCTHLGVGLKEDSGGLSCPAHGSKFDMNGKVTHGPAKSPLRIWAVTVDGDNLVIEG